MALIGAGLVAIGVAVWILLPGLIPGERSDLSVIPVRVNYAAPPLSLTDIQGNPVSLEGLRGQVVLVNN